MYFKHHRIVRLTVYVITRKLFDLGNDTAVKPLSLPRQNKESPSKQLQWSFWELNIYNLNAFGLLTHTHVTRKARVCVSLLLIVQQEACSLRVVEPSSLPERCSLAIAPLLARVYKAYIHSWTFCSLLQGTTWWWKFLDEFWFSHLQERLVSATGWS